MTLSEQLDAQLAWGNEAERRIAQQRALIEELEAKNTRLNDENQRIVDETLDLEGRVKWAEVELADADEWCDQLVESLGFTARAAIKHAEDALAEFRAQHTAAGCGMDATTGSLTIRTRGVDVGYVNDVLPPDRVGDASS